MGGINFKINACHGVPAYGIPCMSWYHAASTRAAPPSYARAARAAPRSLRCGPARGRRGAEIEARYRPGVRDAARLHPIEFWVIPPAARGRLTAPFILKYCVKLFAAAPIYFRAICQFGHPVHEGFQFGTGAPGKVASLVQVAVAKLPVWSV